MMGISDLKRDKVEGYPEGLTCWVSGSTDILFPWVLWWLVSIPKGNEFFCSTVLKHFRYSVNVNAIVAELKDFFPWFWQWFRRLQGRGIDFVERGTGMSEAEAWFCQISELLAWKTGNLCTQKLFPEPYQSTVRRKLSQPGQGDLCSVCNKLRLDCICGIIWIMIKGITESHSLKLVDPACVGTFEAQLFSFAASLKGIFELFPFPF